MTTGPMCGYLGCLRPATVVLRVQYGRDWFRCDDHKDHALDVLTRFDNRQVLPTVAEEVRAS